MEAYLSAAITYLMVLKSEPWNILHVRQRDDQDDQILAIGATGWKLEISLDEMKSSVFGIGGVQSGGLYLELTACELTVKLEKEYCIYVLFFYGNTSALVSFSMLEMTAPGRIMIWQAENPVTQYTLLLKAKLLLQIIKAGLIGNWKYLRRLILDFAICGQRFLLTVTVMTLRLVKTMWERIFANPFDCLE